MNTEALQQLRRVVQDAPDDLFHMRALVEESACGTARCAIGWAAVDPWFQANTRLPGWIPSSYAGAIFPTGRVWDALDAIFGISCSDTSNLFAGDLPMSAGKHAVSKTEVLWNIDELLAGRNALPYMATGANVPVYALGEKNESY
jgi:hypothetical protein